MKKIIFLLIAVLALSGCATYKFQKGPKPPYNKGYVASYWGDILPEYTIGKNNTPPASLALAKERFNRRRLTVEKYYKEMGYIENRYKEVFWDPPVTIFHVILGIFKLPFIAYSDYRYENDAAYRAKVIKAEEDEYEREKARVTSLRAQLSKYIEEDLNVETVSSAAAEPVIAEQGLEKPLIERQAEQAKEESRQAPEETAKIAQEKPEQKAGAPAETKAIVDEGIAEPKQAPEAAVSAQPEEAQEKPAKERKAAKKTELKSGEPTAVIIARPMKGFSPLKVIFSGTKSHSPSGRIVSYEWDFGDGDTSTKPKPVNTFFSTTYGARNFTVTLTVKDAKGMTATASQEIEVMNK